MYTITQNCLSKDNQQLSKTLYKKSVNHSKNGFIRILNSEIHFLRH